MADLELTDDVRDETRGAWHHYLGLVMPFRPELHRYCRKLTCDLWDAEDLIQDTLLRGFGTLGTVHHRIRNPRSYLLRIATNLWIDTVRRRGAEANAASAQAEEPRDGTSAPSPSQATEVRDAGAALMQHLAPQERAAILLKDVFDMSLEETAEVLRTTIGAVKAALHRGRSRLREPEGRAAPRSGPSAALIDRFVERYNERDLPALLEMMLDTASIEGLGFVTENGR
ncbi:MAG: RNA polymerase sigma factor, partial [Myxococcota bacterium]